MKNILFAVTTAFCVTVGADLAAQTKTNTLTSQQGSDSTATESNSQSIAASEQTPADSVPTTKVAENTAVIKNIAMSRPNKMKRGINGYYIMDGNRDRGTNGSMNHYEPRYTNSGAATQPIYETGVEEPADSSAIQTEPAATQPANDGWGEESQSTKSTSKDSSSKKAKAKTEEVPW